MAQPSSFTSCAALDDSFGPHAGSCRGGFDFTLLFEETILTLLPLGLVLIVLPARAWLLLKRPRKVVASSLWPSLKIVSSRRLRSDSGKAGKTRPSLY